MVGFECLLCSLKRGSRDDKEFIYPSGLYEGYAGCFGYKDGGKGWKSGAEGILSRDCHTPKGEIDKSGPEGGFILSNGSIHIANESADIANGSIHIANGLVHIANGSVHVVNMSMRPTSFVLFVGSGRRLSPV
jgi:hypothetical protein